MYKIMVLSNLAKNIRTKISSFNGQNQSPDAHKLLGGFFVPIFIFDKSPFLVL